MFHIPDEPTRKWVVQRGIWHVDDCLMFVSTWDPKGIITVPKISTIPVWLTLKGIPHQLYSKKGISWIASGIGAPMLTSKPWLDPILMGEVKIMVEVSWTGHFLKVLHLKMKVDQYQWFLLSTHGYLRCALSVDSLVTKQLDALVFLRSQAVRFLNSLQ